ncbi:MAG: tol-pal system protein YbgF [Hyphomicrobiaceae bacterium]
MTRDVLHGATRSTAMAAMLAAGLSLGAATASDMVSAQTAQNGWQVAQNTPRRQPAKSNSSPAKSNGDSDLRHRVEQLEEQLVDLQVVLGTVESLAKSGRSAGQGGNYGGGGGLSGPDAGRIAALETQVQALTAQLEQMAAEIRSLRGNGTAVSAPPLSAPPQRGGAWRPQSGPSDINPPPASRSGFNTTTSQPPGPPPGSDPIGSLLSNGAVQPASTGSARQAYERAYGHLLQQNYDAAQSGFTAFLQRYPNDDMAANAQFWLGETYFVRGQWDEAAAAFLKVAQNHAKSAKAPDSLAKLAMALERKGNRQAACRALAELNSRYPNPPAYVKNWESAERRRAGCA